MPDAPPSDAGTLSARAQDILRRAELRLAALAPPETESAAAAGPAPRPAPVHAAGPLPDLGELLDTVQAGIDAVRAHLMALSASLERIAAELRAEAARR